LGGHSVGTCCRGYRLADHHFVVDDLCGGIQTDLRYLQFAVLPYVILSLAAVMLGAASGFLSLAAQAGIFIYDLEKAFSVAWQLRDKWL